MAVVWESWSPAGFGSKSFRPVRSIDLWYPPSYHPQAQDASVGHVSFSDASSLTSAPSHAPLGLRTSADMKRILGTSIIKVCQSPVVSRV